MFFFSFAPTAQLLISRGCSLSLKSPNGDYPLHLAVLYGDIELVQMLLDNRADVTAVDFCGKTSLHLACLKNSSGTFNTTSFTFLSLKILF